MIGARALERELGLHGNLNLAGQALGTLLHNVWMSLNPGTMVLGGKSCVRYPELFDLACKTLNAHADAAGMAAPVVRVARYGQFAAAAGAAALVLHNFLRPLHDAQRDGKKPLLADGLPPINPVGANTSSSTRPRPSTVTVAA